MWNYVAKWGSRWLMVRLRKRLMWHLWTSVERLFACIIDPNKTNNDLEAMQLRCQNVMFVQDPDDENIGLRLLQLCSKYLILIKDLDNEPHGF